MKIYVAGSSKEASEITSYMAALRTAGLTVTYDWTVPVLAATKPDAEMSADEALHHARLDMRGVMQCDALWLLVPATGSTGAWVELGTALGAAKRPFVIVSGDYKRCIFTSLADERYPTHGEAYDRIWRATRASA